MKGRYARKIGSVGIVREAVEVWMVIVTDEVPHDEILAAGFVEIPSDLSDGEVKALYGVNVIYEVKDSPRQECVN